MTKAAEVGHNSNAELKSFIDRIESLAEEKQALADDIKEVIAKAAGHNPKAVRRVIAIRKRDRDEWLTEENAVEAMLAKLGML